VFFVEGVHHYGIPVLAVVPGALLVLCALVARRLMKSESPSDRIFELPPPYGAGLDPQAAIDMPPPAVLHEDQDAR
jgi:hypothetical protein